MYQQTKASVAQVSPLSNSILRVLLNPQQYINYYAGQYLKIKQAATELCFSIANAPLGAQQYELHIRHSRENASSQLLLHQISEQHQLSLMLPFGNTHSQRLTVGRPLTCIAAGTGYAPIQSVIEYLLGTGDHRAITLLWGARVKADLYCEEKILQWQQHVADFNYFMLLPGNKHHQTLAEYAIAYHGAQLLQHDIIIAGPFEMAYATRDALLAWGMPRQQLFSDAFDFECDTE